MHPTSPDPAAAPAAAEGLDLRRYLATRDLPCPGCRYNLRGLISDRCPECNQPLELQVSLAEPRVGQLLWCVIPLFLTGGLFAVGLVTVGVIIAVTGDSPGGVFAGIFIVYPAIAATIILPLAFNQASAIGRGRFRLDTPAGRLTRVIASYSVCVMVIAAWITWLAISAR